MTIGDLIDLWLTPVAEPAVAPLTYRRYRARDDPPHGRGMAKRWKDIIASTSLKDLRPGRERMPHDKTLPLAPPAVSKPK